MNRRDLMPRPSDDEPVEIRGWRVSGDEPDMVVGPLPREQANELACDLVRAWPHWKRIELVPPLHRVPPATTDDDEWGGWKKCNYQDLSVGDSVLLLMPPLTDDNEGGVWMRHRVHRIGYATDGVRVAWVDFTRGSGLDTFTYRVHVDHPRGLRVDRPG